MEFISLTEPSRSCECYAFLICIDHLDILYVCHDTIVNPNFPRHERCGKKTKYWS